jgi:hypothetical protein
MSVRSRLAFQLPKGHLPIDFREGDEVDEEALKELIRAAVALNTPSRSARDG